MKRYVIENFTQIEPVECPCGWSKRAFVSPENKTATFHQVDISAAARAHYHKRMTEMYFILEGEGHLELDGERLAVKPQDVIMIKPGCRHRVAGKLKIINVAVPAFDSSDEYED
ncbi:MAG: cupin domain-containing protein [Spirochaetales bacterium]|jgi:mannose-6-phosphate isomerase-like protein (cupin superfamily)|nr:cupin domain-containing protein [Spirochaetales bacterium]